MFQDGTACAGTRTVVVRADRIDCARRVEDPAFFGSSVFWGGIAAWGKTKVGPILHPFGMKTEDFIPPTGICNPPSKKSRKNAFSLGERRHCFGTGADAQEPQG